MPPPRNGPDALADAGKRYGDLGIVGSGIQTPVLDSLAQQGVWLTSYYVQRACSPTRAALMTGRYNWRYGMQSGVLEPGQRFGLDLRETTLPEAVRRGAGGTWTMSSVGKWRECGRRWGRAGSLPTQPLQTWGSPAGPTPPPSEGSTRTWGT